MAFIVQSHFDTLLRYLLSVTFCGVVVMKVTRVPPRNFAFWAQSLPGQQDAMGAYIWVSLYQANMKFFKCIRDV